MACIATTIVFKAAPELQLNTPSSVSTEPQRKTPSSENTTHHLRCCAGAPYGFRGKDRVGSKQLRSSVGATCWRYIELGHSLQQLRTIQINHSQLIRELQRTIFPPKLWFPRTPRTLNSKFIASCYIVTYHLLPHFSNPTIIIV